jgi:hypothetical protein
MNRRDDTSAALTEIRTVRSRAQSAIEKLQGREGMSEMRILPAAMDENGYHAPETEYFRDPDADEMEAVLTEFIEKTARWARGTGTRSSTARPGRF